MKTRTCRGCGETYPLNRRYFHKAGKGKYKYYCKACRNKMNKEYNEKRKSKMTPFEVRAEAISSRNLQLGLDNISGEMLEHLLDLTDNRCIYCNTPFNSLEDVHFDHIIPASKREFGIVVPACKSCNLSKLDNDLETFYEIEYNRFINGDFSKKGYVETIEKIFKIYNEVYK